MGAEVINMADRRKPVIIEKPSVEQLAHECCDEIAGNWERFARNNRLNDYFVQSVPLWTTTGVDYLSDLNALSVIESKINLGVLISAPGVSNPNQIGWLAIFKMNDVNVGTPPMFSEAYARCFNILLFLKLGRELTQAGIPVN